MRVLLPLVLSAGLVAAQGYGGYGGGGDDDKPTASSSSAKPGPSGTSGGGATGGRACPGSLMCITATVTGSTTLYELSAVSQTPGWMAIGFGSQMADTPMVIMWTNPNGTVTLSQRQADNEIMPVVVTPPRTATLDTAKSNIKAAAPTFAFSIPSDSSTQQQRLIWAWGGRNPGSADVAAVIQQHDPGNSGTFVLDVSKPLAGSGGTNNGQPETQGTQLPPLTNGQKLLVAHAILFVVGFLLLLPAGALFARLLRIATPSWFKLHWSFQFYLTAPILIAGLATAVAGVQMNGGSHFDDTHMKIGLVLCILYVVQCSLGAFIHFVKDANRTRRPPQNYLHAIFGLTIIALAFVQTRIGYKTEWVKATGRDDLGNGINILWIVWVVLLPVLYFGGLVFLPKQWQQEQRALEQREAQRYGESKNHRMANSSYAD